MNVSVEIITVHLRQPFATSHDLTVESQSAIIHIEHEGVVGFGEAKMAADACGGIAEPVGDYVGQIGKVLGDDPFVGLAVHNGKIVLPEGPGLGVTAR